MVGSLAKTNDKGRARSEKNAAVESGPLRDLAKGNHMNGMSWKMYTGMAWHGTMTTIESMAQGNARRDRKTLGYMLCCGTTMTIESNGTKQRQR